MGKSGRRRHVILAAALTAACAQVEVREAPRGPGATVVTEDKSLSWLPGLGDEPGIERWTRIRVAVPAGASKCRSTARLQPDNPYPEGAPDNSGVVMLTVRKGEAAQLACDTPQGKVRRSVKTVSYVSELTVSGRTARQTLHVLPPLVHMDIQDSAAQGRWAVLETEICSDPQATHRLECKPGMMDKLRAADLGG